VYKTKYQSMQGSLLYVAVATRPDISHAVGALLKFNSALIEAHLAAAKRIIRYGKLNFSIQHRKSGKAEIIGYSDNDGQMIWKIVTLQLSTKSFNGSGSTKAVIEKVSLHSS